MKLVSAWYIIANLLSAMIVVFIYFMHARYKWQRQLPRKEGGGWGGRRGCYGLNDGPLKYMDALRLLGDTVNIKFSHIIMTS